MLDEPRHIDLHLPKGWNDCTASELEIIAEAMIRETLRTGQYHVFDITKVKIEALFRINHLIPQASQDEDTITVAFEQSEKSLWQRIRTKIGRAFYDFDKNEDTEAFELPVSYVHAMVTQYLGWIDDERAQPLLKFPYSEIGDVPPLLDGYSWSEYRHLQDWMQAYLTRSNQLVNMQKSPNATVGDYADIAKMTEKAKVEFLKVLLRTEQPAPLSQIQWQVVLFWWSGLMKTLEKKFPRVFKKQPVDKKGRKKKQKQQSPWDFYNQVTATLQKDGKLSEDEINRETYSVTLQKLEMIAREGEEMARFSAP